MDHSAVIVGVLFIGVFLLVTAMLRMWTERFLFPYTVALLVLGFFSQYVVHVFQLNIHLNLSTDLIYFVLLPLLLFESAYQVNAHQFRLQFKTITFLATFGLLLSIFAVAVLLSLVVGLPMNIALLFGALISSTDPIAVLTLFKSLGAPKRLGLLAEGESMLNDATGVIAFRLIASFVVAESQFSTASLAFTTLNFVYVFVGSLVFGGIMGYLCSLLIAQVKHDRLIEITFTVALALISFVAAEYFFHLSGVISTVAAGIVFGNFGKTRISSSVIESMHQLWEYVGFLAVSAVFFFAAFNLVPETVLNASWHTFAAIGVVLAARAISVYVTFFISNTLPFFKDEPNVPLSWQHILTWGGLRGVIPLVLVYSLPDNFVYKGEFLTYTLATFLFTLFVNATTIGWLLKKLGLHLPKLEEEIIQEEISLFQLQETRERLRSLPTEEFDSDVVSEVEHKINQLEVKLREHLISLVTPREFARSLRLQAFEIERKVLRNLFLAGHITEAVLFEFEAELDLQQDAIEYPSLSSGRGLTQEGRRESHQSFRKRLQFLRHGLTRLPLLGVFAQQSSDRLVLERFALLQARVVASTEVINYLVHLKELMHDHAQALSAIDEVEAEHERMRLRNSLQMQGLEREYQRLYKKFELQLIESYAWENTSNSFAHH